MSKRERILTEIENVIVTPRPLLYVITAFTLLWTAYMYPTLDATTLLFHSLRAGYSYTTLWFLLWVAISALHIVTIIFFRHSSLREAIFQLDALVWAINTVSPDRPSPDFFRAFSVLLVILAVWAFVRVRYVTYINTARSVRIYGQFNDRRESDVYGRRDSDTGSGDTAHN